MFEGETLTLELIAVQQQGAALELLHEQIMSKKSRTTALPVLQEIVLKFVQLSVELGKDKIVKEGLHQFKNIAQNLSVTAIEQVIKVFVEAADAQVTLAQSKADRLTIENIEDLEEAETPEALMTNAVTASSSSKERNDRLVVMPWLRFLWEAYRTSLDIVRNNPRMEALYQVSV